MKQRWLLALWFAAACAGPRATASGTFAGIRIAGNQAVETGALEPGLALYQASRDGGGGGLDPYLLSVDTDRIRAAYLRRGFFEVKVSASVEAKAGRQIVVFTVIEGRRARARVEITGLPAELSVAEARSRILLADGEPFDYDTYEAAKQPLVMALHNAGYAHAEVRGSVIADPAMATARYEVMAGPLCTFGAIRLPDWLDGSLAAAVRARLEFASGDRYAAAALDDTQAELHALGRFSTVQVVPDRSGNDSVIDVVIELAPAGRYELLAGGGLGYEPASYEAHGRGGLRWVPAPLPLLTVAGDARVALSVPQGADRDQVLLKFRGLSSLAYQDLVRPRLTGELAVGFDYQTVEAYTWTGEHVRLGLATPLGPRWLVLRAGWTLELVQFTNPDVALDGAAIERLGLDRDQLRGAYHGSLVVDLRDDPIEPHRGLYADLRVAGGTRYALGDLTYLQVTPEVRGYLTLAGVVVALRARVGAIVGDVPVTERYFSGGTAGQRGFSYRRLSPIASRMVDGAMRSVVIGGAGLIETGVELRRELGAPWQVPFGVNVFLDGGDVTDRADQLDPARLYWTAGAGAWAKIYGAVKLRTDLGYRLNDSGAGDPLPRARRWYDNLQFHIGIGEAF